MNFTKKVIAGITALTVLSTGILSASLTTSAYNISDKVAHGIYMIYKHDRDYKYPIIASNSIDLKYSSRYFEDNLSILNSVKFNNTVGLHIAMINTIDEYVADGKHWFSISTLEELASVESGMLTLEDVVNAIYEHSNNSYYSDDLMTVIMDRYEKFLDSFNDDNEILYYDLISSIIGVDEITGDCINDDLMCALYMFEDTIFGEDIEDGEYLNRFEQDDNYNPILEYPIACIDTLDTKIMTYTDFDLNVFAGMKSQTQSIYNKTNTSVANRRQNKIFTGASLSLEYNFEHLRIYGYGSNDNYATTENSVFEGLNNSFVGLENCFNKLVYLETKPVNGIDSFVIPAVIYKCDSYRIFDEDAVAIPVDVSSMISNKTNTNEQKLYYIYTDVLCSNTLTTGGQIPRTAITGLFTLDDSFNLTINEDSYETLSDTEKSILRDGLQIPQVSKDDLKLYMPSTCVYDYDSPVYLMEYTIDESGTITSNNSTKLRFKYFYDDNGTMSMYIDGNKVSEVNSREAIAYPDDLSETHDVKFETTNGNTTGTNGKRLVGDKYDNDFGIMDFRICLNHILEDKNQTLSDYYSGMCTAIDDSTIEITHIPSFRTYGCMSTPEYGLNTFYDNVTALHSIGSSYINYYSVLLNGPDAHMDLSEYISEELSYTIMDLIKVKKCLLDSTTLTDEELSLYDLNSDGNMNIIDLIKLKQILLV